MDDKKPLLLDLRIPYGNGAIKYIGSEQLMGSNAEKNAYLYALMNEVKSWEGQLDGYEIHAVRLSGGAATVMKPDLLGQLLNTVRKTLPLAPRAEISFDALPGTVCTPSLTGIAAGRPNRAELMMRSYVDEDLKLLGCPFTLQDVKNSLLYFAKFHMNNLGFTVNYGFPGHTMKNWEFTVRSCAGMSPAHITVVPVRAEGGADEAGLLEMYEYAVKTLTGKGYIHYGKGLFCLPGHEYLFESLLSNGREYVGMGLNAYSCFDGVLMRNTNNLRLYMLHSGEPEKLTSQAEAVDDAAARRFYVNSRLTTTAGFVPEQYEKRFGEIVGETITAELDALTAKGLLEKNDGAWIPTAGYLSSL